MTTLSLSTFTVCFLGLVVFSYLCTESYRRYAIRKGVMDTPTARSSHELPTPRGGGISIIIGFLIILGATLSLELLQAQTVLAIAIASLPVAIIGLIDDHTPLSSKLRFSIHLMSATIAVALLPSQPELVFGPLTINLTTIWVLPTAFALTWLTNLYNFMDGIDGIAATEALTVILGASIIVGLSGSDALPLILLCAPLIGFLILNWAPAKIFMGDAGSGFLGTYLGILALATSDTINLWCWIILLSAFIADASWTLITRILTGQQWHSAHRSHAYQILNRKLNSAPKVNGLLVLLNLCWLTPLAYFAQILPNIGALLCLAAIIPVILTCHLNRAGQLQSND